MKSGILLLNFGGPWTLADVKPFLYRLFSNPNVLVGVPTPLRHILAFIIAQVKGPSSIRSYQAIGGSSPQFKWTAIQAARLRGVLGKDSHYVEIGMRSAEPSITTALRRLKTWGAEEVVLLPLFPQFSTTTTGTCFDAVAKGLRRLKWKPSIRQIRNWPDHSGYIQLLRRRVDEAIAKAEKERNGNDDQIHVIFSAHSLPMRIVERGDPYPQDVDRTIEAVSRNLAHPCSLAFQSRNGKLPWLGPYLEDELKRLAQNGIRRVVVVPISFVSDHVETLFELDQLYAEQAKAYGITHYYRARCFNDDPEFARVLLSLFTEGRT